MFKVGDIVFCVSYLSCIRNYECLVTDVFTDVVVIKTLQYRNENNRMIDGTYTGKVWRNEPSSIFQLAFPRGPEQTEGWKAYVAAEGALCLREKQYQQQEVLSN